MKQNSHGSYRYKQIIKKSYNKWVEEEKSPMLKTFNNNLYSYLILNKEKEISPL